MSPQSTMGSTIKASRHARNVATVLGQKRSSASHSITTWADAINVSGTVKLRARRCLQVYDEIELIGLFDRKLSAKCDRPPTYIGTSMSRTKTLGSRVLFHTV